MCIAINKCATILMYTDMYGHSSIPTLARGIAINMWVQGHALLRIDKYTSSETKLNEYQEFKSSFYCVYRAHSVCVYMYTHLLYTHPLYRGGLC